MKHQVLVSLKAKAILEFWSATVLLGIFKLNIPKCRGMNFGSNVCFCSVGYVCGHFDEAVFAWSNLFLLCTALI